MSSIENTLLRLEKSSFRSSFHLSKRDKEYVKEKGNDKIRSHAYDFIKKRLAPANIPNDGAQTPTSGHPVFKAQHACACCCRGCLNKWYRVPKDTELSDIQIEKIVNLLMAYIEKEMSR